MTCRRCSRRRRWTRGSRRCGSRRLKRDIVLPIKVVLLVVLYYFLFVAVALEDITPRRMPTSEIVTRWLVTLENVQALYWV